MAQQNKNKTTKQKLRFLDVARINEESPLTGLTHPFPLSMVALLVPKSFTDAQVKKPLHLMDMALAVFLII